METKNKNSNHNTFLDWVVIKLSISQGSILGPLLYFLFFSKTIYQKLLTLNLLTSTIVAPSSNANKWQMGFNSAFKGLMENENQFYLQMILVLHSPVLVLQILKMI